MSANNKLKPRTNAKPALQALKERDEAGDPFKETVSRTGPDGQRKHNTGGLSAIFAASAGALVPGSTRHAEALTKTGDEAFRLAKTKTKPPSDETKAARGIAQAAAVPKPKYVKKEKQSFPPALILVAGVGIGALLFSPAFHSLTSPKTKIDSSGFAERVKWEESVQFHREHEGTKLNRERVQAEYDNISSSPAVGFSPKVKAPDMMKGLPLAGEDPTVRAASHDRIEPANQNYADVRTQTTLDDERRTQEWDQAAGVEYQKEFIANAARAGYTVKIDKAGVAHVVGARRKVSNTTARIDDSFSDGDGRSPSSSP